jgi:cbb3-type cytochrome oxidase subunit 1
MLRTATGLLMYAGVLLFVFNMIATARMSEANAPQPAFAPAAD